ncbi:hypothetical protein ACEPAI_4108 [Sanghuangporus weigelae]
MARESNYTHHVLLLEGTVFSVSFTGDPSPSHIHRLFKVLIDNDNSGPDNQCRQKVYYEPGVGSDGNLIDVLMAPSFARRVVQSLDLLRHNYRGGDKITIIGYSRGAAQAMVLTRYIRLMGIPPRGDSENRTLDDPVASAIGLFFKGVIFRRSDALQVICCYSADEDRLLFHPAQYDREDGEGKSESVTSPPETRAELAVFRGSHSDVGGASESRLRFIPLRYAIVKAHTMEPKLRFQRRFLENLGLHPGQLGVPRQPPLVDEDVDYDRAVGQGGIDKTLLQEDQLSSAGEITKASRAWKFIGS